MAALSQAEDKNIKKLCKTDEDFKKQVKALYRDLVVDKGE